MVELKAKTQTVKPGGVVLFDEVTSVNNINVMHRSGSGVVTIKNMTSSCPCNNLEAIPVIFSANIAFPGAPPSGETAATTPLSLAFAIGGEPDTTTEMVVTPAAADEFFNVSKSTLVTVPKNCCTSIAIENTSNGTITVENATFIIES